MQTASNTFAPDNKQTPALRLILLAAALCAQAAVAADCEYKASPADAARATGTNTVVEAWYGDATKRYKHGVLGDSIEAQTLYAKPAGSSACALEFTLGSQSVFEDVTPRIADVTGDGRDNIITIESDINRGASLAVYGIKNHKLIKIAATPAIGTRYRWLAPIGTADFNNDNILDIAYIETPHLAGVIKIWSFAGAVPRLLAQQSGYSNHRIGENFITGGITTCEAQTRMILPSIDWRHTHAVTVAAGEITSAVVADNTRIKTIANLLQCLPATD